jgi:aminoglycoside 6'-N-acetyltransferase I
MTFSIRQANEADIASVTEMAGCIWHSADFNELQSQFREMIDAPDQAILLAFINQDICGFAQCGLRRDYVEGTSSSPVGYLEGIYVKPAYRKKGCARELLSACENWSKGKGCNEFASDCELTNQDSLHFHLNVGFQEANRIICFTKKL